MNLEPIEIRERATHIHARVEKIANAAIRSYDACLGRLHLGGRKGAYDDSSYEFLGGARDGLRKKHYDKSLRLLWKAEDHAPWSSFRDCNEAELALEDLAARSLSAGERAERRRIKSAEFRSFLDDHYSPEQKQAIVNVLSSIGHGEAYAWLVSTEVLNEVRSTGGRAALTMQVVEEAKHFVVLRELIQAFECPIPRLSAWEYLLLERGFKSKGLEKFFAMNVLVEGFALSLFGMLSTLPGLEVLRLFHLDESRHTALPANYFREFPMSWWERNNPLRRIRRLSLVLPAVPVLMQLEHDLAVLGIDSFEFGGSMARKILHLSDRVGFRFALSNARIRRLLNGIFNAYCAYSRPDHAHREFLGAETTLGDAERRVEAEALGVHAPEEEPVAAA